MTFVGAPTGLVIIVDNVTSVPSDFSEILRQLGVTLHDYSDVEREMTDAGFRVVFQEDLKVSRDWSNPTDDVVAFFQMRTGRDEVEVRAVIDRVFSQPSLRVSLRKLAIFTK